MPARRSGVVLALTTLLVVLSAGAASQAQDKKSEQKVVIYDDENFRGKNVTIHSNATDMNVASVKFAGRSESLKWELPKGKAAVLYDQKDYKKPVLILVGKGEIKDLGKEQPNALHSIRSLAFVAWKGEKPKTMKDIPVAGEE
jgi:hypothetical protein